MPKSPEGRGSGLLLELQETTVVLFLFFKSWLRYIYSFVCFLAVLGLRCCCAGLQLWSTGSVVSVHGLHRSTACGIFLDPGSNPRPLNWQADS